MYYKITSDSIQILQREKLIGFCKESEIKFKPVLKFISDMTRAFSSGVPMAQEGNERERERRPGCYITE